MPCLKVMVRLSLANKTQFFSFTNLFTDPTNKLENTDSDASESCSWAENNIYHFMEETPIPALLTGNGLFFVCNVRKSLTWKRQLVPMPHSLWKRNQWLELWVIIETNPWDNRQRFRTHSIIQRQYWSILSKIWTEIFISAVHINKNVFKEFVTESFFGSYENYWWEDK